MKSIALTMLVTALAGVGMLMTAGCETNDSQDAVIILSPVSANLAGRGATATFVASAKVGTVTNELILPLSWSIGRGDLGRILSTAGVTAIYESNGKIGANTITVVDQIGQAGVAAINQVEEVVAVAAD